MLINLSSHTSLYNLSMFQKQLTFIKLILMLQFFILMSISYMIHLHFNYLLLNVHYLHEAFQLQTVFFLDL